MGSRSSPGDHKKVDTRNENKREIGLLSTRRPALSKAFVVRSVGRGGKGGCLMRVIAGWSALRPEK